LIGAAVAIVLAFSLVLGGGLYQLCGLRCDAHGLPVGPVTEMNLKAHPEAALYYPNSTVLESHAHPEVSSDQVDSGYGSIQTVLEATGTLQTLANSQAIFAWYSDYLTAHGWQAVGQAGYQTFTRGRRERFEVNFNTNVSPNGWLQYSTRYSIAACTSVSQPHPGTC
jgi:hypothetical protein